MDEAVEKLANAIIIQAVKDYRKVYRTFLKNPSEYNKKEVERHEAFFKSAWYRTLTELDGEYLLMKVRRMEEKGEN